MSGFAPDWLRLREPLDLAARDVQCATRFVAAVLRTTYRPVRVLDLASGSGSSFRALAPCIGIDQHWTLTDHDERLLAAQRVEIERWSSSARLGLKVIAGPSPSAIDVVAGTYRWTARGRAIDLGRDLAAIDFDAFDGITTSAFLDLVSASWLDGFARKLAASRRPLLAALSVDGRRDWLPATAGDDAVGQAFAAHQARDKGFGRALGPAAATHLARSLEAAGYGVTLANSDWHVGVDSVGVLETMLEDEASVACEARPDQTARFDTWLALRREQLARRELSLRVGHLDLLALPDPS